MHESSRLPNKSRYLFFLLFAAVVSLVYFGPYLNNFFVGDDYFYLERILQGPGRLLMGYNDNLRVISNSVWWPMYALSGLDPYGYNLCNLALYLLNAVILYRLLDRLCTDSLLPLYAAGFFVAGGAGADAVFWRGANSTLLNAGLYLLTLYTYVLFRQFKEEKYRYLSLGIFLLALFSKEEAASLPLVIVMMELLIMDDRAAIRRIATRVLPYIIAVMVYVGLNYFVIYQVLDSTSFLSGIARFRPLYSLFAGWTVFFLSPDGYLELTNPLIYGTAAAIPASFFLVRDKKPLLFAYAWVFLTFLPQSLSSQSQFLTDMVGTSISRHLYLPSIGSSLALAILLRSVHERISPRANMVICTIVFTLYLSLNCSRVHNRGERWKAEGADMAGFISGMQQALPNLPERLYFTVTNPPEGRAFMQAAVRTFYRNPNIFWKNSIEELQHLPSGSYGMFIDYDYQKKAKQVTVRFFEPETTPR